MYTKLGPDFPSFAYQQFIQYLQKLIVINVIKMHLCAQGQQQLQVAPFQKLLRLTVNYNVKDECRASLWPVLDSSLFIWDGSTYGVLIMVSTALELVF